ncbi:MAG: OsmC family protein [Xanthobacteraceae bacterium]|nr:OsmC family protein [Xanthobacteraceae bacterium]
MTRNASAVWTGAGKDGQGQLTTQSGTLAATAYSAGMRFGDQKGTNPEELIAAAHAGCFNMALAFQLSGAGHPPERLETRADLTIAQEGGGWRITTVVLDLKAKVPGISRDEFQKLADGAKANCPVSKVLNADITLKAELE